MNNLFGVYTGIVIDSTGYEDVVSKEGVRFVGQVLVKIRGVTPSLFNEEFRALPAANVKSTVDLTTAVNTEVLAYVMQPLMGGSTPGVYSSTDNTASPMRKNAARQFKFFSGKLRDVFSDGPKKYLTPVNNPYGNNYFPNYPWNAGLGNYSIPDVNTRVIVGFLNGIRTLPVVLGKLPLQDEVDAFYNRGGAYVSAPGKLQNYNFNKPDSDNTESTEGTTQVNEFYTNNINNIPSVATTTPISPSKSSTKVMFFNKLP